MPFTWLSMMRASRSENSNALNVNDHYIPYSSREISLHREPAFTPAQAQSRSWDSAGDLTTSFSACLQTRCHPRALYHDADHRTTCNDEYVDGTAQLSPRVRVSGQAEDSVLALTAIMSNGLPPSEKAEDLEAPSKVPASSARQFPWRCETCAVHCLLLPLIPAGSVEIALLA